jgi:hypothetical protein
MRDVLSLWKLVRRMRRDAKENSVMASLTLMVEQGGKHRRAWEVNYLPTVGDMYPAGRGHTVGEALAKVLRDR